MRVLLTFGLTYRATIEVSAVLAGFLSEERLAAELKRYQLFGSVVRKGATFDIIATFRGKTGEYELPDEVKTLGIVSEPK